MHGSYVKQLHEPVTHIERPVVVVVGERLHAQIFATDGRVGEVQTDKHIPERR